MKVADAPAHSGLFPDVNAIETAGVTVAFTVMVIALEVAGLPVTPERFEVITQVTICPVVKLVVVKVGLLVPAFTPFIFH